MESYNLVPGDEEWEAFEDLIDDMEMAALAISEDVNVEAVIGNVFADDSLSRI